MTARNDALRSGTAHRWTSNTVPSAWRQAREARAGRPGSALSGTRRPAGDRGTNRLGGPRISSTRGTDAAGGLARPRQTKRGSATRPPLRSSASIGPHPEHSSSPYRVGVAAQSPTGCTVHTTTKIGAVDVLTVCGFRCASATRTILDLAAVRASPERVAAAVDSAIRLRLSAPMVLVERLGELRGKGRHGVRLLDRLLLDSGGESMLERRFLALIREAHCPGPRRNSGSAATAATSPVSTSSTPRQRWSSRCPDASGIPIPLTGSMTPSVAMNFRTSGTPSTSTPGETSSAVRRT